ncbi:crAss001_48 related protein, partial [Vibrio vulnificus]
MSHIERVKKERNDLKDKIDALGRFIYKERNDLKDKIDALG